MKIGISTASLYGRTETEDAFEIIKQTGADCCGVYLQTFYEYRPEFAKKFAARAQGLEVNCVQVAPNNFEPQLFNNSRRVRGDGFYWLDQVMRSAQILGAKNYTFQGDVRKGAGSDNFDAMAERLREVTDFCARFGVTVCLENVRWATCNRPEVFRELKNRCPQLAAVFNIKQARKSGYPYQMYINNMEGAISHVILSDADESGRTCLPNTGVYDFKEIFKRLKGTGFDGSALIETGNFKEVSELKNSVEFLKELADKV
ncbi:MAG: sugar phosphate isomerase/epimerase [Clostridia bacterium]|nr:sugar phosphate isomerase/epimerase [Clostridia bacterium]